MSVGDGSPGVVEVLGVGGLDSTGVMGLGFGVGIGVMGLGSKGGRGLRVRV